MLRINIPLTTEEMRLLIGNAERQCRAPKDQARFILRSVLMDELSAETGKPIITESVETKGNNKEGKS